MPPESQEVCKQALNVLVDLSMRLDEGTVLVAEMEVLHHKEQKLYKLWDAICRYKKNIPSQGKMRQILQRRLIEYKLYQKRSQMLHCLAKHTNRLAPG